jgi:hypothetical protein
MMELARRNGITLQASYLGDSGRVDGPSHLSDLVTDYHTADGAEYGVWHIGGTEGDLVCGADTAGADAASADCASLKFVEIPDDVEWLKQDRGTGGERVAEKHGTWR